MTETGPCSVTGCEQQAAASLNDQSFCRGHFISTCYAQLEAYTTLWSERQLDEIDSEAARRLIRQCMRCADELERGSRGLDNLERARLLDIILWAAELGPNLRRSPRRAAAVPVRVRFEQPGHPWEEETQTRLVSRYGALIESRHQPDRDETLLVERMDTGRQGRARVVWQKPKEGGRYEVGIEFLDCENFWEMEWGSDQVRA